MTDIILTPETVQRFAGSLLHFLWQGAALAVAASIALRMLHRRSAELRYTVSVVAMLLMLAAPVATFVFYKETGALALQLLQLTGKTLADATPAASFSQAAATAAWTRWILLTWCIGVFTFTARLVAGWRLSHHLVHASDQVLPDSVVRIFEDLKQRLELSRPIQLLIHAQIDTPMVVGCLKPAVLVPLSALTGLNEEQLTAILAHELAHIRRHDFLINILQRCVESLLFYHPGVWWLSARIRTEREHCCDDVAVRLCGDRRSYVQALVELERKRQTVPVLSVAATGGSLVQRVHRILGVKTSDTDWQSAAATLVFVLVWLVAGAWQSSTALQAKPVFPATAAPAAVVVLPAAASQAPVAQAVNAIAAIITAQPQPQPPTELTVEPQAAGASPGKGAIQGMVTRAGSSQPIPGAIVSIVDAPPDPEAVKKLLAYFAKDGVTMDPPAAGKEDKFFQSLLDTLAAKGVSTSLPANQIAIEQYRAENRAKYTAVADAGGRFTFKDVPSGKYTLAADLEGYFGSKGNEPTAVVESNKPADIAIPLMPGATISGRVKNTEGRTVSNILVTAYLVTYANGKILPVPQSSQRSDDRGEYRLFWLPPGEYIVQADPTSAAPPPPPPPPPGAGRGGPVVQADVAGGIIGGRGSAIAPSSPKYMKTFYPQSLTTTEARTLNVNEGEQVSGTDITLQKSTTYKISGTVHAMTGSAFIPQGGRGRGRGAADPNAPQGVTGYLGLEYRDSSVIDMRSSNLGGTVPSVGTFFLTPAEDGFNATFEVANVLPGEYFIVPRLQQAVPQGSGNFTINRVPIDIRDRDITNLALELFVGVNINGTVTVDGHAPGTATVRVALRADGNPSPTYQGITSRAVMVKADDGAFVIPTVPPTRYRVELGTGLPPDLYVADVKQGPASVFDSGIEVGKEAPAPVQVTLRSGAGVVEGFVRDGAGKPVVNATVVVIPPDARRENRELYKMATSDGTGRFTIRGIAPGGYKLFAWQGVSGGDFYNSRFLSKYEFRGKSINVAQGGTLMENLTIIDRF